MDSILDRLEATELRPFPAVATKVLNAATDPTSKPADITKLVACEPSIAIRVLKVANSPAYGFARQISTLDQAVVVLGNKTIRDLVLTVATADLYATGDSAPEAREALWNHSLSCATVASILAARTGEVAKDEAFLAGILHDVGKLIFYDVAPAEYSQVNATTDRSTIISVETDTFGTNHQEIGQRCIEEWDLPDEVHDAICFHHSPSEAVFAPELTELVSLANSLSREWQIGCTNPSAEPPEATDCENRPRFDDATMEELKTQSEVEFEQLLQACQS